MADKKIKFSLFNIFIQGFETGINIACNIMIY